MEQTTHEFRRPLAPYRQASMRLCKQCGKFYVLSDSDAKHYIVNYGQLPLRCEECRQKARERNNNNEETNVSNDTNSTQEE